MQSFEFLVETEIYVDTEFEYSLAHTKCQTGPVSSITTDHGFVHGYVPKLRLVFMTPGNMDFHRVPQSKIKILLISVLFVIVFS